MSRNTRLDNRSDDLLLRNAKPRETRYEITLGFYPAVSVAEAQRLADPCEANLPAAPIPVSPRLAQMKATRH